MEFLNNHISLVVNIFFYEIKLSIVKPVKNKSMTCKKKRRYH